MQCAGDQHPPRRTELALGVGPIGDFGGTSRATTNCCCQAVLSPSRYAGSPNVPTAIEAAYAGLTAGLCPGLFEPKVHATRVINKLHHSLQSALGTPEMVELARAPSLRLINEQPADPATGVRAGPGCEQKKRAHPFISDGDKYASGS